MPLPLNFVSGPNLQENFLFNGLPVTGEVRSFSDINRTTPKSIFVQSGSPPNYMVTPLPNPTPIAAGILQDGSNNDVVPVYNIVDAIGDVELYFIEVYDSLGNLLFTREGWPQGVDTQSTGEILHAENFITNGQFRWNLPLPVDAAGGFAAGEVRAPVTFIAPGGWQFVRSVASTATDFITFFRYPQYVVNPSGSPRFALELQTTVPDAASTVNDVRHLWGDVNKFASTTQEYTFWFNAQTLDGATRVAQLVLRLEYGSGGTVSPPTEVVLTTFSITPTLESFIHSFTFGIPGGANIGTNNDDSVSLSLRFPTNVAQHYRMTDFVMAEGNLAISEFPVTTDRDFVTRSLTNKVYTTDDLYLPVVFTPEGFSADASSIGNIEATLGNAVPPSISTTTNLLLADGSSYPVNGVSPLGIPYSRLYDKYFSVAQGVCQFGSGPFFVDAAISSVAPTYFFLSNNQVGIPAVPADGVPATGFTFFPVTPGTPTGHRFDCYLGNTNEISGPTLVFISNVFFPGDSLDFNTSVGSNLSIFLKTDLGRTVGSISVTGIPPAGASLGFNNEGIVGNQTYLWYTVDGAGVDPGLAGTPIQVNLRSTWTTQDVAMASYAAARGHSQMNIAPVGGGAIPPGANVTFSTVGNGDYYFWYTVDGAGVDPLLAARTGIQVDVLSGDSASAVTLKTQAALNSVFVAVPDLRGMALRGMGDIFSPQDTIFSESPYPTNLLAHYSQIQDFASHNHPISAGSGGGAIPVLDLVSTALANTFMGDDAGGISTRPTNFGVYYQVRY